MTDDERERRLAIALRERFPVPTDVDLLARIDDSPRSASSRGRVLLAVAACVALVAALSIAIVFWRSGDQSDPASPADQLIGVTWAMPGGTLVFTDDSVRIFDGGCTFYQRQATIGDGVLEFGTQFGGGSNCLGRETPEDPRFARIATSETRLTWHRTGDTLSLTDDHGETVRFHRDGPAWYLTDQEWVLEDFVGPDDYEQPGDPAARLRIANGTVHATDVCNDLTGTAVVTDSTVTFTHMSSTDRACSDPRSAALAKVVDRVLSGPVSYTIARDGLTLSDEAGNLLGYTAG